MARKRSQPTYDTTIPADWTAHDGTCCPVDADSMPAVMHRYGAKTLPGCLPARYFFDWACGNLWVWSGGTHDIVAYKPEADFGQDELTGRPWHSC